MEGMPWYKKKWIIGFVAALSVAALAQQRVLIYGEDQNGDVKPVALGQNTGMGGVETKEVAKQSGTLDAIAGSCVWPGDVGCQVILSPVDLSTWTNITITLSADTSITLGFTQALVEWSPDGIVWERWDNSTFVTPGSPPAIYTISMAIAGNSRKWLRMEVYSGSNNQSYTVWVQASR